MISAHQETGLLNRESYEIILLYINMDNPQPRLISQVVDALRQGAVVCYPTDTMYGIGCDIFNQKAVKRIYQIKKRPKHKPFSFMCSSLKEVSTYCFIPNNAYRLIRKCIPGGYTFILPTMKIVPKIMTSKQKTVGIRVPDCPICQKMIRNLENPILNTSATISGEYPVTEAYEVEELLGKQIDIIIDSGPVYPMPSSVISLVNDQPEIIREGKGDISLFR